MKCIGTPGFGDHDTAVLAEIQCHPQRRKKLPRKVFCWNKANLEMLHALQNNLGNLLTRITVDTPVDTIWKDFKEILLTSQEKHVLSKTTSTRYSKPWINKESKRLIRIKNRRYKNFKRTKQTADWEKYQEAARTSKKSCTNAYNNFIKTTTEGNQKKKLYSIIKAKRTEITGVAPLKVNDKTHTKDIDIAGILNEQFTSVFSDDDGSIPTSLGTPTDSQIDELIITRNGIVKLLNDLNPNTASGPDKISGRILKECSEDIADTLVLLFNASLNQGKIPTDWKHALITPVFKGGNNIAQRQKTIDR